jgi:hypothetical protein
MDHDAQEIELGRYRRHRASNRKHKGSGEKSTVVSDAAGG